MILTIRVSGGEPGEESVTVSRVSQEEIYRMAPFLEELTQRHGYFPTGDFFEDSDKDPEELYSRFQGYAEFEKYIPKPGSGFRKIEEILVSNEISRLIF